MSSFFSASKSFRGWKTPNPLTIKLIDDPPSHNGQNRTTLRANKSHFREKAIYSNENEAGQMKKRPQI